jgi:hypothetical protein
MSTPRPSSTDTSAPSWSSSWFASGPRVIDIANPLAIKQAAWWLPDVPPGQSRVCSNDVYEDGKGLIYLIDRNRGLSILERI